jgi:hypothetical protein
LTVKRTEAHANLLLSDGRELLKDALPRYATEEELVEAGAREILSLVIRDLTNVMPYLKEFSDTEEKIQIPYLKMKQIREMAFLRGHIPYLTQKVAATIGKKYWFRSKHEPRSKPEIFEGIISNVHAYSCDWICSEMPEHLHNDIYANGKPGGGRGFNRKAIFDVADEEGIEINSIPAHPLERDIMVLPVAPKSNPDLRNDLPAPPLDMRVPPSRYPLDQKAILQTRESEGGILSDKTFAGVLSRIKMDAREEIYRIQDKAANRYQMMQYIPWAITEGKTLREICKGINGTPTMLEISRWLQYYPDFRRELENAEAIQAQAFMDQAQEIIMDLDSGTSKEALAVARAQSNFLMKRAALQSEKFREKKVIQTENLDSKNEMEVKKRLKMLLRGEVVADIIDIEPLPPEPVPDSFNEVAG